MKHPDIVPAHASLLRRAWSRWGRGILVGSALGYLLAFGALVVWAGTKIEATPPGQRAEDLNGSRLVELHRFAWELEQRELAQEGGGR